MAFADHDTDIVAERDEARRVADVLMNWCVRDAEGEIALAEPRNESTRTLATLWLAAETRAARLDRACEVG